MTFPPFTPTRRKPVGYPQGFQNVPVWLLRCNKDSVQCVIFSLALKSWVVSRNASCNGGFPDPWGGTPGRRYTRCPCLYCLPRQATLGQSRHNAHVLFLSLASWLFVSLNAQLAPAHNRSHEAPRGPSRSSRAGGPMASASLEAGRRPGEALRGQLGWGATALAKKPSWDLSYPSQRFTAVLYKAVSRWHAFHSNVFGNCQKQGNANILTS